MLRLISGPAANPSWRVLERRSHPAAMLGTQRVVQRGGSIGVAMGVCVGGAAGPSIPAACRHPPPPVGSSWCSEEPFPLNAAGEGFYLFFGCFSFPDCAYLGFILSKQCRSPLPTCYFPVCYGNFKCSVFRRRLYARAHFLIFA